ncbi:MAG: stage III sporulation protein AA [Clostridia bacterium]|nr:stage III sporulation protein AA [Clostridia bacterium]
MEEINQVLQYFPIEIYLQITKLIEENKEIADNIQEIRIRTNKPVALKIDNSNRILRHKVTQEETLRIFEKICEGSIYSYKKQICEGFITIKGGHRIGITGNVAMENDKVININYISSLNFRIARQKLECSNEILKYIINIENNNIYNTLIVSPPGCGKTTILRDIVRKVSNGIKEINFRGRTVGLVDERGEIAAMYKGIPQNDVGIRTDVIDNISKDKGMHMLVRSMSPEIISCDEIGSYEDIQAINYAMCSGVKGIFTAHGGNIEDINLNNDLSELLKNNMLERIIFLDTIKKGMTSKVYGLDIKNKEYKIL